MNIILRAGYFVGYYSFHNLYENGATIQELLEGEYATIEQLLAGGYTTAEYLIENGLATAAEMIAGGFVTAATLVSNGAVSAADMIAANFTTVAELVGLNIVSPEEMLSDNLTTVADLVGNNIVSVQDMIAANLTSAQDLLAQNLTTAADLCRYGIDGFCEAVQDTVLESNSQLYLLSGLAALTIAGAGLAYSYYNRSNPVEVLEGPNSDDTPKGKSELPVATAAVELDRAAREIAAKKVMTQRIEEQQLRLLEQERLAQQHTGASSNEPTMVRSEQMETVKLGQVMDWVRTYLSKKAGQKSVAEISEDLGVTLDAATKLAEVRDNQYVDYKMHKMNIMAYGQEKTMTAVQDHFMAIFGAGEITRVDAKSKGTNPDVRLNAEMLENIKQCAIGQRANKEQEVNVRQERRRVMH
tara:strand:- start:22863 stop:24101 length:1239 start_codon:yes stop_codon:yes gene_type:complete